MKKYLLLILVIVATASCSNKAVPTGTSPANSKDGSATAGTPTTFKPAEPSPVALFAANCARCHGDTGIEGNAPRLDHHIGRDEIVDAIYNGAGRMPKFSDKLSEKEINAITDFIMTLSGTGK